MRSHLRAIRVGKWIGAAACALVVVMAAMAILRDALTHDPDNDLEMGSAFAIVPALYLLVFLGTPTIILFGLDRRLVRPGFCGCGYDLTGNVSGVCPECGIRIVGRG